MVLPAEHEGTDMTHCTGIAATKAARPSLRLLQTGKWMVPE